MTTQRNFAVLGLFLSTSALTGCNTTGTSTIARYHTELSPEIGTIVRAEIGETVIERTEGIGRPSLQVSDLIIERNGYSFLVPAKRYPISYGSSNGDQTSQYAYNDIQARSDQYKVNNSNHHIVFNSQTGQCTLNITSIFLTTPDGDTIQGWMNAKEDDAKASPTVSVAGRTVISGAFWDRGGSVISIDIPPEDCVRRYQYPNTVNTMSQELIYLGRSGDTLSFKYREYYGSRLRDGFTADLTYDLSDSDTIGYKGARMSVLEAGNQYIRYKVLKHIDPM